MVLLGFLSTDSNYRTVLFYSSLIQFIHLSVICFTDFDWVKLGLNIGTVKSRLSALHSLDWVEYAKLWR